MRHRIALSLAVLLVTGSLLLTGGVGAHPDPGTDPIFTAITLADVCITEAKDFAKDWKWGCNQEFRGRYPGRSFGQLNRSRPRTPRDGLDQNAEFLLTVLLNHDDHTILFVKPFENSALTRNPWTINEQFYDHDECAPRQDVSVYPLLVEIDTGTAATALTAILGAIASSGAGGGLPGAAAGGAVKTASWLNGNDHYGGELLGNIPFVSLPENGNTKLMLTGTDGSAEVQVEAFTGPSPDVQCVGPSPSPSPGGMVTPEQQGALLYGGLEEGLALAAATTREAGNPSGLSDREVAGVRDTLTSMAMGLGQIAAGSAIDSAALYQGTDEAVEIYGTGLELVAGGETFAALEAFQGAFVAARRAELDAEPAELPAILPLHIAAMPSTLSARTASPTGSFLKVFGASGAAELSVDGLPDGAAVDVLSLGDGMFQLDMMITDSVPPGTYDIGVTAQDESNIASRSLTLDITARPSLICGGETASMLGTGGADALTGSGRGDVIVGLRGSDRIEGRGGHDLICGGKGADDIAGGTKSDLLRGGRGDDRLDGNRGMDICLGGRGTDRFVGGRRGCDRLR